MSHYATGTRFEHKIRDDLEANGYEVVRAAGSKGSTKLDLIAIKPGQWLFIQAKRSGVLGPDEWDRVHEVAGWVGAVPLLARNGPRGRGVEYIRLLGPKHRGVAMARQACAVFHLDEIAAEVASIEPLRRLDGSFVVPGRPGVFKGSTAITGGTS